MIETLVRFPQLSSGISLLAEVVYGYLKNLFLSMSRSIENIAPVTVQTLARPEIEKVL